MKPPRVVLDTNTVISALLFQRGRLAWVRKAWQTLVFVPVVDHDTVRELVRVLGYPKFKLVRAEQEALMGDFLPYAEAVVTRGVPAGLPEIHDPKDVIFAALAKRAQVDVLVSGDGDLLALKGRLGRVVVLTGAEFSNWLETRRADKR